MEINGKRLCLVIENSEDAKQTAAFFGAFDDKSTVTCENVTIPCQFNEIYRHYNDLQKAFGTDLSDYSGKLCRKYRISSADSDPDGGKSITLLVFENHLIGGDISDNAFDGTMTGLIDHIQQSDINK